jgi:hypothetical protein
LADALADWFPGHADCLDSALAQWMVKRKTGGVPLVFKRHLTSIRVSLDHPGLFMPW